MGMTPQQSSLRCGALLLCIALAIGSSRAWAQSDGDSDAEAVLTAAVKEPLLVLKARNLRYNFQFEWTVNNVQTCADFNAGVKKVYSKTLNALMNDLVDAKYQPLVVKEVWKCFDPPTGTIKKVQAQMRSRAIPFTAVQEVLFGFKLASGAKYVRLVERRLKGANKVWAPDELAYKNFGYDAYCVRKMPAEAGFVPCFPGRFAWNPATQMALVPCAGDECGNPQVCECKSGYVCSDAKCSLPTCPAAGGLACPTKCNCPSGQVCVANKCQLPTCAPNDGLKCPGKCTCATGLFCNAAGKCQLPTCSSGDGLTCPGECNCPGDKTCSVGQCVPKGLPECAAGDNLQCPAQCKCPAGKNCSNKTCLPSCPADGTCNASCACASDVPVCVNNICQPLVCVGTPPDCSLGCTCPAGTPQCDTDGKCKPLCGVGNACSPQCACQAPNSCSDGICKPPCADTCGSTCFCPATASVCDTDKKCKATCAAGAQCTPTCVCPAGTHKCDGGVCKPLCAAGSACGANCACPNNAVCNNGTCSLGICSLLGGVCTPGASQTCQCPAPFNCDGDGKCKPTCSATDTCGPDSDNSLCVCNTGEGCGPDGKCRPICADPKACTSTCQCPGASSVCDNGICRRPVCPAGNGSPYVCNDTCDCPSNRPNCGVGGCTCSCPAGQTCDGKTVGNVDNCKTDRQVLLVFMGSNPGWSFNGWELAGPEPCEALGTTTTNPPGGWSATWTGVHCTKAGGSIDWIKLDATSNVPTLAGTIPKLGWTLPDTLTRLELLGDKGGKSLTSVIPHYLPVPPRLEHLNLRNNRLSGNIPNGLGLPSTLETLDLAYNQLDGPIPAGLWLGPNIKTVYLDHNLLDGPVPPTWNIPTGSQSYYLQENKLDGPLPKLPGRGSAQLFIRPGNQDGSNPLCGQTNDQLVYPPLYQDTATGSSANVGACDAGNLKTCMVGDKYFSCPFTCSCPAEWPACVNGQCKPVCTAGDGLSCLPPATCGCAAGKSCQGDGSCA